MRRLHRNRSDFHHYLSELQRQRYGRSVLWCQLRLDFQHPSNSRPFGVQLSGCSFRKSWELSWRDSNPPVTSTWFLRMKLSGNSCEHEGTTILSTLDKSDACLKHAKRMGKPVDLHWSIEF